MSKQKKIALICPMCGTRDFGRTGKVCIGDPHARVGDADRHPPAVMVSAALYHSRKASGVNPNPTPLQKPEANR